MRSDMAKVMMRPRRYGGTKGPKGYNKLNRISEDGVSREKIRQKWTNGWGGKQEDYDINPLRGFLRKSVGKYWDDVYSEICKVLPRRIRDRVNNLVETTIQVIGGEVCYSDNKGYRHYNCHKITSVSHQHSMFYVDAEGILRMAPVENYKRVRRTRRDLIKESESVLLKKMGGIWYEIKVKPFKDLPHDAYQYDNVLRWPVNQWGIHDSVKFYGGKYIGLSKRQLSKSELKKRVYPCVNSLLQMDETH